MTWNAIYEIPFGRGRRFGTSISKAADAVFGGWEISGIYNFTSGEPLNFTIPGATLGNGFNTRPNLVGNPRLDNPGEQLWFNPAAFAAPPRLAFGNAGIGLLDAPGIHAVDLALLKDFRWSERYRFQFRWELFNAPNHVNYGIPVLTLNQLATGRINSAGDARQMQFGLKLIF
jgi:hypothetical protein